MTRSLLWGSLLFAPAAFTARLLGADAILLFGLATTALIPLAWIISRATEAAAQRTGPAIGGLLNATFANVPELMIALFAVAGGAFEVVRGSLSGSVVGNLLLVLGAALAVGGTGDLDRPSVLQSLGLIAIAVPALLVAALPYLWGRDNEQAFGAFSIPVAALLLVVYGAATAREIRRERSAGPEDPGKQPEWSLARALALLGGATAGTAAMSEIITGSIDEFAEQLHISEFFAAAVIVAIAGNAAEHGAAVIVAAHGEIKLGADIALESAAQVAAFVIPVIALVSWAVNPLPLAFTPIELAVFAGSTLLAALLLSGGRSSRWRGLVLLGGYLAVAVAFFLQ